MPTDDLIELLPLFTQRIAEPAQPRRVNKLRRTQNAVKHGVLATPNCLMPTA